MKLPTKAQSQDMRAVALETPERPTCPRCGHDMHKNHVRTPGGPHPRQVWYCPNCGKYQSTKLAPKSAGKGK